MPKQTELLHPKHPLSEDFIYQRKIGFKNELQENIAKQTLVIVARLGLKTTARKYRK